MRVVERRGRAGIHAFLGRQMQRDQLADERQVEEAGRSSSPLASTGSTSAITSSVAAVNGGKEIVGALALAAVAQFDEREHLARHVAALTPARQLVVGHIGQFAQKAGDLALRFTSPFHQRAAMAPRPAEP